MIIVLSCGIKNKSFNLHPEVYVDLIDLENFLGGEYKKRKISEIAKIYRGISQSQKKEIQGSIPVIKARDLTEDRIFIDKL